MRDVKLSSRFEKTSPPVAFFIVVVLVVLIALSTAIPPTPQALLSYSSHKDHMTDPVLYRHIIDGIKAGGNYYDVMAHAHRLSSYPLHPVYTVRLPTLAWLFAFLPAAVMNGFYIALMIAIVLSWYVRLRSLSGTLFAVIAGTALIILSCDFMTTPVIKMFHDSWAGLFMALALGLWRPDSFVPSILCAFAAVIIRESALPFLLMMACLAAYEKRWSEVYGWLAALLLFAGLYWLHANAVQSVALPSDLHSPGWSSRGGPSLLISILRGVTPFIFLPQAAGGAVAVLCLFGWLSWPSAVGLRVSGMLLGYAMMVMIFARPNQSYWITMLEPLFLAGLAFVPMAVGDLMRQARKVLH